MNLPVTLAIETSGSVGSVALSFADGTTCEHLFPEGTRHGRDLLPACEAILAGAELSTSSLDRIAVSVGPGSFTGLRVGVSAAKTLAYALDIDLAAVPTLDVLAHNAPPGAEGMIVPVLDARRGHVHASLYSFDGTAIIRAVDYLVVPPDQLAARLIPPYTILGNGLRPYPDLAGHGGQALEEPAWRPRAEVVARLGAAMEIDGDDRDAIHRLEPLYLRISTPEERRRADERTTCGGSDPSPKGET